MTTTGDVPGGYEDKNKFKFMLTHCKIFYVHRTYLIFHASGHADPVEIADRGAVDIAVDKVFSFYTLPCLLLGALKRGV